MQQKDAESEMQLNHVIHNYDAGMKGSGGRRFPPRRCRPPPSHRESPNVFQHYPLPLKSLSDRAPYSSGQATRGKSSSVKNKKKARVGLCPLPQPEFVSDVRVHIFSFSIKYSFLFDN